MVSALCFRKAGGFYLLVTLLFLYQIGVSLAAEKEVLHGEKPSGIDFKNGLLKVSIEKQEFKEIMDEVARETGIIIIMDHPYDEVISVSFDYLPLEKGLRRLLREKDYAFIYQSGEGDVLKKPSNQMKVFIFSKAEGKTVAGSGGLYNDGLPDTAHQKLTMDGIQNQIMNKLDNLLVLNDSPQSRVDQRKQIDKVMVTLKELGLYKEKIEGGVDPLEKIKEALQGVQNMENIINE